MGNYCVAISRKAARRKQSLNIKCHSLATVVVVVVAYLISLQSRVVCEAKQIARATATAATANSLSEKSINFKGNN